MIKNTEKQREWDITSLMDALGIRELRERNAASAKVLERGRTITGSLVNLFTAQTGGYEQHSQQFDELIIAEGKLWMAIRERWPSDEVAKISQRYGVYEPLWKKNVPQDHGVDVDGKDWVKGREWHMEALMASLDVENIRTRYLESKARYELLKDKMDKSNPFNVAATARFYKATKEYALLSEAYGSSNSAIFSAVMERWQPSERGEAIHRYCAPEFIADMNENEHLIPEDLRERWKQFIALPERKQPKGAGGATVLALRPRGGSANDDVSQPPNLDEPR